MLSTVPQFISSIVSIRLALSCLSWHTQLDSPTLSDAWAVVVYPQGCVEREVSHFPSHSRAVSQQVAAVQQRCSGAGSARAGTPGLEQGEGRKTRKQTQNVS